MQDRINYEDVLRDVLTKEDEESIKRLIGVTLNTRKGGRV